MTAESGWSQSSSGSGRADPVVDLDSDAASLAVGEETLDAADSAFSGNPAASMAGWWPENLVAAPIPGYSPQLGWKLTLVAGYFLDVDKRHEATPPSLVGVVAMTTENDSSALGIGGKFYLADDRIRVAVAASDMDLNYRYYGQGDLGLAVDIAQHMELAVASVKYRVFSNLYVGFGYLGGEVDTAFNGAGNLPAGLPDPRLQRDLAAFLLPLEFDTRDDTLFPRDGWLIRWRAALYRSTIGSDVSADVVTLEANNYRPRRERDVLAFRAYFRSANGNDLPFFLQSSFGGTSDLRGYESGRYRDDMMYAVQAEYRWRPREKWVFTGFVGLGAVASEFDGLFDDVLPAGGIGTRYMLSSAHNFSISADFAVGEGDRQFYFGVNEAF